MAQVSYMRGSLLIETAPVVRFYSDADEDFVRVELTDDDMAALSEGERVALIDFMTSAIGARRAAATVEHALSVIRDHAERLAREAAPRCRFADPMLAAMERRANAEHAQRLAVADDRDM